MTTKSEKLRRFVLQYLDSLQESSGMGRTPDLPEFDLYAQDYLEYAEQELLAYQNEQLLQRKNPHLINCIAHLKRAIDCQLDTFFHVYKLHRLYSGKSLNIPKKLEFLGNAGVFSSRSIARLNSIRNKMEHEFKIPEVEDIEVYYDLSIAFVAVLQRTIMFSMNRDIDFSIYDPEGKREIGSFSIKYDDKPSVTASWKIKDTAENLICTIDEPTEFAFFFKVLLLLIQRSGFASSRYIASQIGG